MKKSLVFLILLTVIFPLIALGVSKFMVSKNIQRMNDSYRWAEHTYKVLLTSQELKNALTSAELSLNSYLQTNDARDLTNFRLQKKLLDNDLERLKKLVSDNTNQQENIAFLTKLNVVHIDTLNRILTSQHIENLFTPDFRKRSKAINLLLSKIENVENYLLKSRTSQNIFEQNALKENIFYIFYISLFILLIANIIIFYFFQKQKKYLQEKEKLSAFNNAIIQSAIEAIITFDKKAKILTFNPAAEKIFGFKKNEIIGQNLSRLIFYPKNSHKNIEFLTRHLKKYVEITGLNKNGRSVPLLASVSEIKLSENESFYSAIFNDLSEYKAKESEIIRLSDRLRLATDIARLSIWDWDLRNDTFYFEKFLYDDLPLNRVTKNLFGTLKKHFLPEELKKLKHYLLRSFAKKEKFIEMEIQFIKNKNDIRFLKSRALVQYNSHGKPTIINGVTWDITDLKRAAKIQQEAKEAAQEANKAKSRFLANMSHEIRTPLNAIIGLNLLLRNTPLNEKQRDYVNKIHLSSTNLLSIINDILDFSKIEAGKLQIEMTKFNLDLLLNNLAKIFYFNAREKGLELVFYQDPNIPPTLIGDPLRVSQILSNFLSNALKFTDKGQIFVKVNLVEQTAETVMLKFSVKDTGIGIHPDQLTNLFHSFTQADISTTRKYGGTGLGLSICKQLADMMGGQIGAESAPGKGSTFYFQLAFKYNKEKDRAFYQPPIELRNLRILVVDDIADIRAMIKDQLKIFTDDITAVASSSEAIKELQNALISGKKYYDLIISDWKLNGSANGIELSKKIKQDPKILIKPKTILMSAYIDKDYLKKEHAYFDAFLAKPFTLSVLYNTILEVFGKEAKQELDTLSLQSVFPKGFELIQGARFLVAEDNELNQQVIKELLENQGMFVTIASDGQEAVDIVAQEKQTFDLILMDIQMPVMNGFDAAMAIHSYEKFKDIPIIALTADLAGDIKKRCQESGIVDLISKPIDPDELFMTAVKWIKPRKRPVFRRHYTSKEKEAAIHSVLSSIPGLDYTKGLQRLNYNYRMYAELLIKFYKNYLFFPDNLKSALHQQNVELFHRMIHTLKGVAGNLGLQDLQLSAAKLESALNNQRLNNIQDLLEGVDHALKKIMEHLRSVELQLKEYLQEERTISLSRDEIIKELHVSLKLLQTSDAKAKDKIKTLINPLKSLGFSQQAETLWNAVDNYEFEEAVKITKTVLSLLKA